MKIVLAGERGHPFAGEKATGPGGLVPLDLGVKRRSSAQLAAQDAAGLERAPRLAQVVQHDHGVGDVLEDDVGVDEIEILAGEHPQAVAGRDVDVRMWNAAQVLARPGGHLPGDIHAVDLAEMRAHGQHQPPRAAADFERPPRLRLRQADEFPSQGV